MPKPKMFPKYVLMVVLAGVLGAILRIWFLSHLHHYYIEGGTTAIKASLTLSLLQGHGFKIDSDFVSDLQSAQGYQVYLKTNGDKKNAMIDPEDFLVYHAHRPNEIWPGWDTPGYSFLQAAFWWILPKRYIYIQIFQLLLDLLAIFMVAEIGRILFNKTVGATSAWLYAMWILPVLFSILPLRDYFGIFSVVLSFYLIARFLQTGKWFWLWFSGVSLGIVFWIRPAGFLLPVFYALGLCIYKGWSCGWRSFLTFSIPALLIFYLPLLILNKYLHDRWFVSPLGNTLWKSLGSTDNPYGFKTTDEDAWLYAMSVKGADSSISLTLHEVNDILIERVKEVAVRDPWFIIYSLLYRVPVNLTIGYSSYCFIPYNEGMIPFKWPSILMRYLHKLSWLIAIFGYVLMGKFFGYRKSLLVWMPPLAIFIGFWPLRYAGDPRFFMPSLVTFVFFLSAGAWVTVHWAKGLLARRLPLSINDPDNT